MELPTNFDMRQIMPILRSFGVTPDKLGSDKLAKLQKIAETIHDPASITPELSNEILKLIGVEFGNKKQPIINTRIRRNDMCNCGSGKKWKKCCI